jgi:hypothetical protein
MIDAEKILPPTQAREKIAVAAGAALLVAGLVLVVAILPAEYGVDPLGTGAKLGLTALSEAEQKAAALTGGSTVSAATVVAAQDGAFKQETVELKVGPREFVEYKYRLDKGEALLYSWKTSGQVNFEFHGEPDGAPSGYAETYEMKQAATQASGTFTAPFPGIHGWYWENREDREVTITVMTAGYYNLSHEFRDGEAPKNKMFK